MAMTLDDSLLKSLKLFDDLVFEKQTGVMFHANLFYSQDKITNEQFSGLVAKMLICNHNACGKCGDCVKVESGANPDVVTFGVNSRFNTADVEKIIEEQVLKPMISACKVYVINNIDGATIQAQNKLLKVLEEPNPDVYFIINTTNLDAILPTIKSRCKIRTIGALDYENLKSVFQREGLNLTQEMFAYGGGYFGKICELAAGGDFEKCNNVANGVVFDMKSSKQVLEYSSKLSESKQSFVLKLSLIQGLYRSILMSVLGCEQFVSSPNLAKQIEGQKSEYNPQALVEIINKIDECKKQFEANVNLNMISDSLLMKILEVKYLCKQK